VGASLEGQQYLLTKSLLGNSTALNAAIYLLLKSDIEANDRDNSVGEKSSSSIQAHPVMAQLQKCNTSDERFKEEVAGQVKDIDDQVNYLVKAAALMTSPDQKLDEDSDASTPESEQNDSADENASDSSLIETSDHIEKKSLTAHESSEALKEKEDALLHEARFGLRASEVNSKSGNGKPKRKSADAYFGDLERTEGQGNTRFLASTVNSIEQRSKKKKKTALVEEIDDTEEDSGLAQGLKMMEEELGKLERSDEKVDKKKEVHDDNLASVEESSEGAMKFYNAVADRSKEKKMIKEKRYQVAPKFPVTDAEVPGERAISQTIMKNRGLVPHKAKINRNPRVKKREQYRKALIRRKGAVREIRTDEGHKYGGEGTGIKSTISRSRKL
jgi:U3 small nucleolar RNA-associated protein 3